MSSQCSVEGCMDAYLARGLCSKHYQRQRHTGSPTGSKRKSIAERFWPKVDKSGECWEWRGSRTHDNYGLFKADEKKVYVHRLSFEMANGPIPDGAQIDHRCHNPGCVNPEHLRIATGKQNSEHKAGLHAQNKSGVRGVSWAKNQQKWRATVCHFGKNHSAGYFWTVEEAEAAAIALRNELFTHNDHDRRSAA